MARHDGEKEIRLNKDDDDGAEADAVLRLRMNYADIDVVC